MPQRRNGIATIALSPSKLIFSAKHRPTVYKTLSQFRGWMVTTQEGVSISTPADQTELEPPPQMGQSGLTKI